MSSPPIATVTLDAGSANIWNVVTETSLPQQIRVAYISRTGKTKYKTYMSCSSPEDDESADELKQVDEVQGAGGSQISRRVSSDIRILSSQSHQGRSEGDVCGVEDN